MKAMTYHLKYDSAGCLVKVTCRNSKPPRGNSKRTLKNPKKN